MPRDPRRVVPFCFRFLSPFRSISFSSKEKEARERLSLDSWVATTNNYCGGKGREEKVANDRSTISDSPPFISCFLEVFITWRGGGGGKEHNFAFKYPVVVLCTDPLDQIWKRERDFFSRFYAQGSVKAWMNPGYFSIDIIYSRY